MGRTIDFINGKAETYITCDACGLPILGEPRVEPPSGARDYDRFTHPDGCRADGRVDGGDDAARDAGAMVDDDLPF